jgi:hypothetical protein
MGWERGRTQPMAAQFRPVVEFLGYDARPSRTLVRRGRVVGVGHGREIESAVVRVSRLLAERAGC